MADLEIHDVPVEVYEQLVIKARRAGQTVEDYLRDAFIAIAQEPTRPPDAPFKRT